MHFHLTSGVLAFALLGLPGLTRVADAQAPTVQPKIVTVKGGDPVIQVLPGPAQFADSAAPLIAKMPAEKRQMMTMWARRAGAHGPQCDVLLRNVRGHPKRRPGDRPGPDACNVHQ